MVDKVISRTLSGAPATASVDAVSAQIDKLVAQLRGDIPGRRGSVRAQIRTLINQADHGRIDELVTKLTSVGPAADSLLAYIQSKNVISWHVVNDARLTIANPQLLSAFRHTVAVNSHASVDACIAALSGPEPAKAFADLYAIIEAAGQPAIYAAERLTAFGRNAPQEAKHLLGFGAALHADKWQGRVFEAGVNATR